MLPLDDRGAGPPVVLLHAGVADRTMWEEHLDRLAEAGFRAIAPGLTGFGEVPVTPGPQAPWEDVLRTIRDLDLDWVHLVGNSFGAAVALRVAVVAPVAVRSLLLVSPPPLEEQPSAALQAAWDAEEAALEREDVDGAVAAVVQAWVQPDAPQSVRDRVAAMQRRTYELQDVTEVEEAPDPLELDPSALSRIQVPVLTLAGEADMIDFQLGAREIADGVAQGRTEIIPGAGHLAPLETPDEFSHALREFLESVS